jgi:hypothetical protein
MSKVLKIGLRQYGGIRFGGALLNFAEGTEQRGILGSVLPAERAKEHKTARS